MKYIKKYELFQKDFVYDVSLDESNENYGSITNRYSFTTKYNIKYRILLSIRNGVAHFDFDTVGIKDSKYTSVIDLIGSNDSIKVLNTLKSVIDKHKDIKVLIISSTKDRLVFYKKILNYLNINNKYVDGDLVGYIK